MKKILNTIWKFINSKVFMYVLIIIGTMIFIGTCSNNNSLKDDIKRNNENIESLNDTIKNVKTKNSEYIASIKGLKANEKELKLYNKKLYQQVKNEKGKVITLNNIIFSLRQDSSDLKNKLDSLNSIISDPVKVNDSTWNVKWNLQYVYDSVNYDKYTGITQVTVKNIPRQYINIINMTHNDTWMVSRDSRIGLTWGQTEEKDGIKVYAKTKHPAFSAQLLEGTYVDYPQKDHWFTGFGVGPYIGIDHNLGLSLGVSVHYNIYNW